jgi:hypothetical protein
MILYTIDLVFNPVIEIDCITPRPPNLLENGDYVFFPSVVVECVNPCPEGTEWDPECNDCVPVCFDQILSLLKEINRNLPAKIIG